MQGYYWLVGYFVHDDHEANENTPKLRILLLFIFNCKWVFTRWQ
jgi:hypothetical protein